MVFKLGNEAAAGRDVLRPFVENAANVRCQRNRAQQMFSEETLAFRYIGLRDGTAGGCQVEVTVTQFGKTHHPIHFGKVKEILGAEMQACREHLEIRFAAEGADARTSVSPTIRKADMIGRLVPILASAGRLPSAVGAGPAVIRP